LAKEIAAELRAKFDLNTRPCSIWLDVPATVLVRADEVIE
jgi:hypothetical protein